jgi:hypothetical protein
MQRIATLTLTFAVACGATAAFADMPGADWMPFEQVVQKLKQAGYTQIYELQADDGHWEGEGVKDGKKLEFHADPRTGVITSEHPDR